MKLLANALMKFTFGLLLVELLIFLPAGTLGYANGWLLIGLLFVPMLIAGFVMFFKSPTFLAKRLDAKKKQATQKGVLAFSGLMFIGGFVVAGLDYRFGWSEMPLPVTVVASVLFLMIPLVLGSWYSLIIFAFYPVIIIVRLKDEEDLLTRELPGYAEYKQKVNTGSYPLFGE